MEVSFKPTGSLPARLATFTRRYGFRAIANCAQGLVPFLVRNRDPLVEHPFTKEFPSIPRALLRGMLVQPSTALFLDGMSR